MTCCLPDSFLAIAICGLFVFYEQKKKEEKKKKPSSNLMIRLRYLS